MINKMLKIKTIEGKTWGNPEPKSPQSDENSRQGAADLLLPGATVFLSNLKPKDKRRATDPCLQRNFSEQQISITKQAIKQ